MRYWPGTQRRPERCAGPSPGSVDGCGPSPPGAAAPEHDASIEVSEIFGAMLEASIVVDVSFADFATARPPPLPKP